MRTKNILSSRLLLAGLVASLAVLANVKFRQYQASQAIEAEKASIIAQEEKLEKKNRELSQSLEMLTSRSYKERVIREQLNMKKEGELVYNFTESQVPAVSTTEVEMQEPRQQANIGNAQKWWNYFFTN
jgi:cell division protein FtsB